MMQARICAGRGAIGRMNPMSLVLIGGAAKQVQSQDEGRERLTSCHLPLTSYFLLLTAYFSLDYWQMICPSTPDVAPAPTCTEQFVKPTEIELLVTPTVYPLALVVMLMVLPLDNAMLLAACS